MTKLYNNKIKAHRRSRAAANNSLKAYRRVKEGYFDTINSTMNNNNISAKKKFSILIKLMNNQKYSKIPPLLENNKVINDSKQKSDILNKHFSSKSKVPNSEDDTPILTPKHIIDPLSQFNTSPLEVSKIIRELKKSNMSYCGIPGKFLSEIATPISFILSKVYNNLFDAGLFPEIWKLSHITAIYTHSVLKCDKVNYRPISLLPTLSKICEAIILRRLLSHCLQNNTITDRQAAYMKGDSTAHQLIHIVHKIRETWSHRKVCQGLFLDVSSAFDKVWQKGLISQLKNIGIDGMALKLFE